MKQFIKVLSNKNYLRLFLASFASQMGSVVGLTAFMFYLLNRFSEQSFYATLAELMYSLPTLAVFFLVGVLADRMDRQKIAANCDWISAALSVGLLVTIWIDFMPLIFAFLFIRSATSKFFFPAESSLVQGTLTKDDYTVAAGLNQMMGSLFMLFGGTFGALAYWNLGIEGAIIIDALSFIVSGILILSCKFATEVRLPNGSHTWRDLKLKLMIRDFKGGFTYILSNRLLSFLIIGFFMFGIVNGGFSVMPIFILKYKLAPTAYEEYSVVNGIILGTGILIGSIITSIISSKFKLHQLIITGLFITGSLICLGGIVSNIYIFFGISFIIALFLPVSNIGIGGWLPRIVDPQMMGRVQGLISPLMMLSQSITLGLIAISFPTIISIEVMFIIVGGCLLLVGIFYFLVLPRYSQQGEIESSPSQQSEALS